MQAENSVYSYPVYQEISVKSVYKDIPEIPKGYVQTDFRPPKEGDKFIAKNYPHTDYYVETALDDFPADQARIIVRPDFRDLTCTCVVKFKDIYAGDISIPEGYSYVGFRVPVIGEYIISAADYTALKYTGSHGIIYGPRVIVEPKDLL